MAEYDRMAIAAGKMRIASILVLNNFVNDSRVRKTAKSLSAFGYDVTVFALLDRDQPILERDGSVQIQRVPLRTRNWQKSTPIRLIKLIEWTCRAGWRVRKADVVHSNDLATLPCAILAKLLSLGRLKVVYDAHEFESNQVPHQSAASIFLLRLVESVFIRLTDAVITVSEGIAKAYSNIYAIAPPRVVLNCPPFRNTAKTDAFRQIFDIPSTTKIFLYQGALTYGRGIELLLDVFAGVKQENVVVFMGYGPLESLIVKSVKACPRIFFHPAVPQEVLLDYTSSADVGIVVAENVCRSYDLSLPNKLFEFIMAGLPVVVSNLSEMSEFVRRNRVGVVCERNTVEAVDNALKKVLQMNAELLARNLESLREVFCWESQEIVLAEVYNGVAGAAIQDFEH